eukprot:4242802-Alexandrium_andersonii.AAC.1
MIGRRPTVGAACSNRLAFAHSAARPRVSAHVLANTCLVGAGARARQQGPARACARGLLQPSRTL